MNKIFYKLMALVFIILISACSIQKSFQQSSASSNVKGKGKLQFTIFSTMINPNNVNTAQAILSQNGLFTVTNALTVNYDSNTISGQINSLSYGSNWILTVNLYDLYGQLTATGTASNIVILENQYSPVYITIYTMLPSGINIIYVSIYGNDTNSGTNLLSPVRSIQAGISNAVHYGVNNIYVAQGTYSPSVGMPLSDSLSLANICNIRLSGGWDTNFAIRTNLSVLNGNNTLNNLITVNNSTNIVIDGFILKNSTGTGINLNNVSFSYITNLIISNNKGNGVYLVTGNNNIFDIIVCSNIISNYSSSYGGGIYIGNGNNNVFYGTVSCNASYSYNSYCYGGGIYIGNGNNNVFYEIINNNFAQRGFGGGIYIGNGNSNVFYCTNISNISTYGANVDGGGGVYISNGNGNIFNGSISYNSTSNQGGGIFIENGNSNVFNGIISGNIAGDKGGGVYISSNVIDTILNCTISNNKAVKYGGGIYLDHGNNNVFNCTVIGNNIIGINPYDGSGGGIYINSGNSNIINGDINNNTAHGYDGNGGGIYIYNGNNNIFYSTISGNSATGYAGEYANYGNGNGGGIYIFNGNSNVFYGTINNNSAVSPWGYGGGVYIYGNNNTFNNDIYGNSAYGCLGFGGGIYIYNGTNNNFYGNIISNVAYGHYYYSNPSGSSSYLGYGYGGGVYISAGSLNDFYGSISFNSVSNDYGLGGGIYIAGGNSNNIDCSLYSNSSHGDGSAIYIMSGYNSICARISYNISTYINNSTTIFISNSSYTVLSNTTIQNNISGSNPAVYIYASPNSLFINSIITNNTANKLLSIGNSYGLSITNNRFGGIPGSNVCAICEAGNDVLGQTIDGNIFLTNTLSNLYYDFVNGYTNDISALNDPNYSGALDASGNAVQ